MKSDKLVQKEELWNIISHGVGIILSIIGLIFLFFMAMDHPSNYGLIAAAGFSISMITVYVSSTAYHISKYYQSKLEGLLRTIDHISIFYLIAGTYTPFLIILLGEGNGKLILYIVWAIAVFGTLYKLTLGQKFPKFSLLLYIAMGWVILIDIKTFSAVTPGHILTLILIGGLAYSVGTFFYAKKEIPYNHVIWHLFVLAGSAFHFMAVYELYGL